VDAIREYVRSGATFLAKPVEDGKWLTTGDPLSYLKAVLAYELDRDGIKEPFSATCKASFSATCKASSRNVRLTVGQQTDRHGQVAGRSIFLRSLQHSTPGKLCIIPASRVLPAA
jgi:hypothetical protein